MANKIRQRLLKLGIALPTPAFPLANYLPAVFSGNLLFISGTLPIRDGRLLYSGQLGAELGVKEGYEAARAALLNSLAIAEEYLGELDNIERIVRLSGFVASVEGFYEQPAVLNGASDLLVEIFGESGRHARVAVGVSALPLNAPVEIELTVERGAGEILHDKC